MFRISISSAEFTAFETGFIFFFFFSSFWWSTNKCRKHSLFTLQLEHASGTNTIVAFCVFVVSVSLGLSHFSVMSLEKLILWLIFFSVCDIRKSIPLYKWYAYDQRKPTIYRCVFTCAGWAHLLFAFFFSLVFYFILKAGIHRKSHKQQRSNATTLSVSRWFSAEASAWLLC